MKTVALPVLTQACGSWDQCRSEDSMDSPGEQTDLPPMIKKKSGATTPRHAVVVQLPRVQGLAPCSLHQGHLRRLRRCRRIRVGILDCRCARPLRQEAGRGEGMVVFD